MKFSHLIVTLAVAGSAFFIGRGLNDDLPKESNKAIAQTAPAEVPMLVRPDGSYPTMPLEKDVVVLKVIQSGVNSLSDFPTIEDGLEANLKHMEG